MHRRTVLASATAVIPLTVAGCTGNLVPSSRSTDSEHKEGGNQIPAAHLDLTAADDAKIGKLHAPNQQRPHDKQLVIERAVENESTTVDAETPPIWDGESPLRYDGSVYRLSYDVTEERPATRYFWNLEPTEDGDDEATVQFENLPRLDREKFRLEGMADGGYGDRESLDVGGTFKYANEDRARSALVPSPDRPIIAWGSDRRARFSIRKSNSENATLRTYRYTAEQVAATPAEHGAQLRDQYTFELSGLSDAEREIVEEAVDRSGYTVERGESPPDAFRSLADRFRQQEAVDDFKKGVTGNYLVRYQGEVYWTELKNGDDYGTGATTTASE